MLVDRIKRRFVRRAPRRPRGVAYLRRLVLLRLLPALLAATVLLVGGAARARRDAHAGQTIYSYRNAEGRRVYVNGIERVPKRYLASAKPVDLSHVSLNRKLANDLDTQVRRVYHKLVSSSHCASKRAAARAGFFTLAWRDHGALVLSAGLALLLLIASPFVARRVSTDRWLRLLFVALPLLGSIALVSLVATRTSRALGVAREHAELCTDDGSRATTAQRLAVVRRLRQQLEVIEARRRARLRGASGGAKGAR